jgi:myo-inositol-1(or 4)-monophosphatase
LDELFLATRGEGATLENPRSRREPRPLHLRSCNTLKRALLATGFPYRRDATCRLNLRCVAEALSTAQGVRRGGSAALDLCYLAAGRLDGFWEATLKPWDVAAGTVIAQEAGARVSDYRGEDDFLWGGRIAAAGEVLHPQLLEMLRAAHQDPEKWPLGAPFQGPVPLHPSYPLDSSVSDGGGDGGGVD